MNECKLTIAEELKSNFLYPEIVKIYDFIVNISPENRTVIENVCGKGLTIEFEDSDIIYAKVNATDRHIYITVGFAERLWGVCIASYELFNKHLAGTIGKTFIRFDLNDIHNIDIKDIATISGIDRHLTNEERNIFSNYYYKYFDNESFQISMELFRMSLAYIVLHEIGHIVLDHSKDDDPSINIEEEADADKFAYKHILSPLEGEDVSNICFIKRIYGIISANLFSIFDNLRFLKDNCSAFESSTHPRSFDRLNSALENCLPKGNNDNDIVWGYVVAILSIYDSRFHINETSNEYESFHDAAQAIFERYSQYHYISKP